MSLSLGRRIKVERARVGLSQKELASDSDISQNSLSLIEKDQTDPRVSTITKIAKRLGVSTDYLVGLSEEPQDRTHAEAVG
jgi:transcriptional regulator with XRE-family HTH domain